MEVTKDDIRHELQTNHKMTSSVLDYLIEEGHIPMELEGRSYRINITKSGILHIREFNKFYSAFSSSQIIDHYRLRGLPSWYTEVGD